MDNEAEQALVESIAHWKRLRDGKPVRGECPSCSYCACCDLYVSDDCGECPISLYVRDTGCHGTPWHIANSAWLNDGTGKAFKEATQLEIDFLEEVLVWERKGRPEDGR